MRKLALVIFTVAFAAGTSAASAGGTGWSCRTCGFSNGASFNGLALNGEASSLGRSGAQLDGDMQSLKAAGPTLTTVILPGGEIVDLR
jgi:hypothetical protein